MSGGEIDHNKTGTKIRSSEGCYGGGVFVSKSKDRDYNPVSDEPNGRFTQSGGKIHDNTSASGAGVMAWKKVTGNTNASFIMSGGEVSNNNASTGHGGGVYVGASTSCTISGANTLIKGNKTSTAEMDGGGIYINGGTVSMSNGTIDGNTAADCGGGVYLTGNNNNAFTMSGGTIQNNKAASGAGIHIISNTGGTATATISKGSINGNVATGNGGGIYAQGNLNINSTSSSAVNIYGNKANNGAGIFFNANGTLTYTIKTGTSIYSNAATTNGGGVYLNAGTFTLNGGEIGSSGKANSAANGGGVFANSGTFTYTSGTVAYNTASTNGGGVYSKVTFSLPSGSSISNNSATSNGGGVYVAAGTFTCAGTMQKNAATGDGGGVYLNAGGFTLNGGTIGTSGNANTAKNGGGVFANSGTFTYTSGTVAYNTASTNGGGVYSNVNFTLPAGKSINNNGAANGGGVYVAAGTFTCNGNILSNTASTNGAGVYVAGGALTSAGTMQKNAATGDGGGVYLNAGGFTLNGGTIGTSGNANSAANGGGIYANTGTTFTYTSGTIAYNTATTNGGGVYSKVNFTLPAGKSINNNSADYGGGVYVAGGAFTCKGNIRSNTATTSGGGVYKYSTMTVEGTVLIDNNTVSGAKNNVFIPLDAAQKYVNIGALNCTSSIGVTKTHDYQTSTDGYNAQYTRIVTGTAANCKTAYDNRFFFDDKASYGVFQLSSSPYANTNLYFVETWKNNASASGVSISGTTVSVNNAAGLAYIAQQVNNGTDYTGYTIQQAADIDMSAHYWEPIGYSDVACNAATTRTFKGNYDGQYYTISNLKTVLPYDCVGMFGCVDGGTITNTFVVSGNFNCATSGYMGGLVGQMTSGTITNSEAAVTMTGGSGTYIGGLAGEASGTIHSCSAMPVMSGGSTMGGLVGRLAGGTLKNSFANVTLTTSGTVGGLIGSNGGTMDNCYVRGTASFTGTTMPGTVTNCYGPSGTTVSVSNGVYTNPVAPYLYTRTNDNTVNGTALLALLNQQRGSGAEWKRTTAGGYSSGAGNINGDFPVHKYANTTCVASTDGKVLDYHTSLDNMLTRHTSNTTVNLYAHDNTSKGTGLGVTVYIDENISLLQSTSNAISAYTCQVLPGSPRGWHFLSSSLSDSGIGFNYGTTSQVPFSWDENPCNVTISNNNDQSLYPSDLPNINKVDLYCFYEPEYHWINLKRNSNSHWHMNATTVPIAYPNETTLTPGKGYLVSIDQDQLLQNRGTLNNGDVSIGLDYTPHNEWAGLLGYNLIGNPYQSYLDFSGFASKNMELWAAKGTEPTYAVYDAAMGGYIQYKEGTSRGAKAATGTLNMHQGFIVRTSTATTVTFTNAMRSNTANGATFRDEQPAYPLINLTVTDDEGVNDFAVLELGRDNDEGAEKLRANDSKGWLYLHHGNENYGILFRSEVEDYQPLWFEADEAGAYTLSWETANVEFESLTLVDNITGRVTDMLATSSYAFEADPSQYESRFKIVIGDWKDVEEHEAPELVEGPTFAYQSGDEIIVDGEGRLEVVDMLGRVVACSDASQAPTLSTAGLTPGVYILRLNDGKGTKVQKMVIK